MPQQLIAVEDIGVIAAKAFSAPEEFIGRVVPLVGDVLTVNEQAEILSRVLGRPIRAGQLPGLIVRLFLGSDLYRMFKWTATTANSIPFDRNELRTIHPGLLNFESWARKYLATAAVPSCS